MVQKQLPTGFRDDIGAVAERKMMWASICSAFAAIVSYTKISTPLVEYKDVFNGYTLGRGQHMSNSLVVLMHLWLSVPI